MDILSNALLDFDSASPYILRVQFRMGVIQDRIMFILFLVKIRKIALLRNETKSSYTQLQFYLILYFINENNNKDKCYPALITHKLRKMSRLQSDKKIN